MDILFASALISSICLLGPYISLPSILSRSKFSNGPLPIVIPLDKWAFLAIFTCNGLLEIGTCLVWACLIGEGSIQAEIRLLFGKVTLSNSNQTQRNNDTL